MKMCSFTTEKLTDYFVHCKDRDGLERQDWKSLNSGGYKLFAEGHVQDVMIKISNGDCLLKASCLPEMKKDKKYTVSVTINHQSTSIIEATCCCPAGCGPHGSCKHIAALCFSIESFVRARDISLDLGEEACTAALQKWNQPRKRRLNPMKAEEISFRTPIPSYAEGDKRSERKAYDPRPLTMQSTSQAQLDEFRDELEELPNGTGFSNLLYKPCDANPNESISPLPLIPRSVQCRVKAKLLSMPLPPSLRYLQELGEEFVEGITPSNQQKLDIEKATRMQANCLRWHEERYCRLTASNFGAVVKRRSAHSNLATTLLSNKMLPSTIQAIKWGKDYEKIALAQYSSEIAKLHPNLTMQTAGLYIGQPGYLGASPDGVLVDVQTGVVHGIVEIKCPFSAAKLTVREACAVYWVLLQFG